MTLVIVSCQQLRWLLKNTSWREQNNLSQSGLITKTESTCKRLRDSTPSRLDGQYFLIVSISPLIQTQFQEEQIRCSFKNTKSSSVFQRSNCHSPQNLCGCNSKMGGGCPCRLSSKSTVIPRLRTSGIHWAHSSPFKGHPGIKWRLFVIQQRFQWERLTQDVTESFSAYQTCVRNKGYNRASAGTLHPLPVPCCSWSDIYLNFVTGLWVYNGKYTTIKRVGD